VQHGNPVAAFVMGLAPAVVVVRADEEQAKNERFFVAAATVAVPNESIRKIQKTNALFSIVFLLPLD